MHLPMPGVPLKLSGPLPGPKEEHYAHHPTNFVRNFEHSQRTLCTETGTLDNLNLSSIATRLIQDVGRFCERFASNFIISWDAVRKQLEPRPITEPYHAV